MITPFFTITQDDEYIFIDVKISHVRFSAQGIEMVVQGELFVFALSPYYLRIRLPYRCVDDERLHAEYDLKSESVKIKIPKETTGQFFPDLDLSSKLLARQNEQPIPARPLIEELDVDVAEKMQQTTETFEQDANLIEQEATTHGWEIEQAEAKPENALVDTLLTDGLLTGAETHYGFGDNYNGVIGVSVANGNDINELGDPEGTTSGKRIMERLIKENIKFDPEFYAADYIMEKHPGSDDDKNFSELLEWKNPITKTVMKWYRDNDSKTIPHVSFTREEQEKMIDLPRKTYLDSADTHRATVILFLFAYHYDMRETEGDHNIESAWTIGKLAPQIATLDSQLEAAAPGNLQAVVLTGTRRALCYPLHRNLSLCRKVWDDVYYNLRGGKRLVLRLLLAMRELFRFHDVYYVYAKIWLDDLCAFIASDSVSEATLRLWAHDLKRECESLTSDRVVFEKTEEGENQEEQGKDEEDFDIEKEIEDDGLIAISAQEIEQMAEERYDEYVQMEEANV